MRISVVIPTYNAGTFIEEAIASVLAQKPAVHEIIVVNDGSTDRDYSTLEGLDGRVRVLQQPNRGVAAARNAGFQAATAEYIAILDADDVWLPGKIAVQAEILRSNPEFDAVFCRGITWFPESQSNQWVLPQDLPKEQEGGDIVSRLYYPDFLCGIPVAPSTMVIKRSIWKELSGYKEGLHYGEDYEFYFRLSFSHQVALVERFGMLYRRHAESATAKIQIENHWATVISSAVSMLGTRDRSGHTVNPERLRKHLASIHFQHGYRHFWLGDLEVAREAFWQSVRRTPFRLKAIVYLMFSYVPVLRDILRGWRRERTAKQGL